MKLAIGQLTFGHKILPLVICYDSLVAEMEQMHMKRVTVGKRVGRLVSEWDKRTLCYIP